MGWLPEVLRRRAASRRAFGDPVPARGGYTLLELLLTLSILGVLLALAVLSFTHLFSERRADSTAAEVQRVLRATQQLATAQAGRFRRVEARFSFGEGPRAELWGVPWQGWRPAVPLGSVGLGAPTTTVRKSGALEFTVAFAASGSPLPGSQGTLEVADGPAVRYVVVAAVTGRVRVSRTP